ncbi:MAG: type II toxin-antitoxin system RelE/ParE family toxin [Oscillospiraceae bacterium]|nr:type II toxin-antitoxin system RelE/ParE family toxin [Oscillospiraceae bacterium]
MERFKVFLTEPAENDLKDIALYISVNLHEPSAALNTINAIETKIENLEIMPLAYPLVRDDFLASLGYRLMPVKNYHVFYIAYEKEKTVDIERILYSRRNWKHII